MKACIRVAYAEYKRWLGNPRIVVLLLLIFFAREVVGKNLCEHAADMGQPLQLFEPFVALCNSYVVMLIAPVFFLVMMADFPVMEGSYMWSVYRMGKIKWIMCQLMTCIMCSLTIILGLLVSSIISSIGHVSMSNSWSNVITQYYLYFPDKAGSMVTDLLSADIYNQMTPAFAVIYTVTLSVLSMVLYSVILMCGKIYGRRYLSFALCIGLIGAGTAMRLLGLRVQFLFPSVNATVSGHYGAFERKALVPMAYSYIYFAVTIILAVIISIIGMKRRNICRSL